MSVASAVPLFEALSDAEQRLLDHLHDEANPATGLVHGFTFTRCSQELGLGRAAGRRTMGPWLQRLADLSLVEILTYPLGRRPGTVRINRANPRETARSNRAVDAWQPRETARQPRAATARPRECHKEQDSLEQLARSELASSSTQPKPEEADWHPEELDDLLRPVLDFCVRCSPPLVGMTNRVGTLQALRPYRRAEVEHAVRAVLAETKSGGVHKPIGLLVAMAKTGAPEYFTAAADRPAPPVADEQEMAGTVDPLAAISAARQALGRPA